MEREARWVGQRDAGDHVERRQIQPGVVLQSGQGFDPTKTGYSALIALYVRCEVVERGNSLGKVRLLALARGRGRG